MAIVCYFMIGCLGCAFGLYFPLPQDCIVDYSSWTECDVDCGQGEQKRWGEIRQPGANGGQPCPPLEANRVCDSGVPCIPIPIDCQVDYTPWTACDADCGQGFRQRFGTIRRSDSNGGLPCPALEQTQACDSGIPCSPPPVDCIVDYSAWSSCDVNCGEGEQQRWGSIRQPSSNGGLPCPPLEETRTCDSGLPCTPPPVDCLVDYSPWTECSGNCGQGEQQRWGTIRRPASNGGLPCLPLEQTQSCDSVVGCSPRLPSNKPFGNSY